MTSALVLAVVALLWHAVFMLSIFDIYFRSPLCHGMPPHAAPTSRAPADRVVLFVADGLRADRAFEITAHGKVYATWSVVGQRSHTQPNSREHRSCAA
jgi:phosphatidylinositol glycan class N